MTRAQQVGLIIGVFLDQLTKWLAEKSLNFYTPKIILAPLLEFQLVHNYGAAYGIFQHQRVFLIAISTAVFIGVLWFRKSIGTTTLSKWGIMFLLTGTLGNLIDRAWHGYVIDFINIHIFPVFNLADISINIALGCFVLEMVLNRETRTKS